MSFALGFKGILVLGDGWPIAFEKNPVHFWNKTDGMIPCTDSLVVLISCYEVHLLYPRFFWHLYQAEVFAFGYMS